MSAYSDSFPRWFESVRNLTVPPAENAAEPRKTLKDFVSDALAEIEPEAVQDFHSVLNKYIYRMVKPLSVAAAQAEKMAGLEAMSFPTAHTDNPTPQAVLADLAEEESMEVKAKRFLTYYRYLSMFLPDDDEALMNAAARVFEKIIPALGQLIVDFQVPLALGLLRRRNSRKAGCLMLSKMSKAAPVLFQSNLVQVFPAVPYEPVSAGGSKMAWQASHSQLGIWLALHDPDLDVRLAASVAVNNALDIFRTLPDIPVNTAMVQTFYNEAIKCLRIVDRPSATSTETEHIHAGLLAIQCLLTHGGMFLSSHFGTVCELVLSHRHNSSALIRQAVVETIPRLATYNSSDFARYQLETCVPYLLDRVTRNQPSQKASTKVSQHFYMPQEEQSAIYVTLGLVAANSGGAIIPYIDQIVQVIKDGLRRSSLSGSSVTAVHRCLGSLSAVGTNGLSKAIEDTLDDLFNSGLNESLITCLNTISANIGALLGPIQERLIDRLSIILAGVPFRPTGAPSPSGVLRKSYPETDPTLLTLALRNLGLFDFTGWQLASFAREYALPYTAHTVTTVRQSAAQSCATILSREAIHMQTSSRSIRIMSQAMETLVTMAISDPAPTLRRKVLKSLSPDVPTVDEHLSQPKIIRLLFMALNDGSNSVREPAAKIIGRVARLNPAYVLPMLRVTVIQLLKDLEHSSPTQEREDAATLLGTLAQSLAESIRPYTDAVMRTLLPKKQSPDTTLLPPEVIRCIGKFSDVGGRELRNHFDAIFKVCLAALEDERGEGVKRRRSLLTLCALVSNTGNVITPYFQYTSLVGTLIGILRTDKRPEIRRATIKLVGILGALDPLKQVALDSVVKEVEDEKPMFNHRFKVFAQDSKEYFDEVAIHTLLEILRNKSLHAKHRKAIEAIVDLNMISTFNCSKSLPEVLTAICQVAHDCALNEREPVILQLASLIRLIQYHARPHIMELIAILNENWTTAPTACIVLLQQLSVALMGDFKPFIASFVVNVAELASKSTESSPSAQIMALQAFGSLHLNVENFNVVIPVIVKVVNESSNSIEIRLAGIRSIGHLCSRHNIASYSSRVIQSLCGVLTSSEPTLLQPTLDSLAALAISLKRQFKVFIPYVTRVLEENNMTDNLLRKIMDRVNNDESLTEFVGLYEPVDESKLDRALPTATMTAVRTSESTQFDHFRAAYIVRPGSSSEDWFQNFAIVLLRNSPSLALQACASMAVDHPPLATQLFNNSFLACWTSLPDDPIPEYTSSSQEVSHDVANKEAPASIPYKSEIINFIELQLRSPETSLPVMHALLDLAEFMARQNLPLPISNAFFADQASRIHVYAKALHYQEAEYFRSPTPSAVASLININEKLQQPDAAWGMLAMVRADHNYDSHTSQHEEWFEKLGRWQDALDMYGEKMATDPHNKDVLLGKMRCLHALGEWEQLSNLVQQRWVSASQADRTAMAPIAAAASWSLREWDTMEMFVTAMGSDEKLRPSPEYSFYRAILEIQSERYAEAGVFIERARDAIDPEFRDLVSESYERSYGVFVRSQTLSELEEIISYKRCGNVEWQSSMREIWAARLNGCLEDVEVWQRILQVRALVLTPDQDTTTYARFANLCRKADRLSLAQKVINSLMKNVNHDSDYIDQNFQAPADVVFCNLKYQWSVGKGDTKHKYETIVNLREFATHLANELPMVSHTTATQGSPRSLLARCYHKLAVWTSSVEDNWIEHDPDGILTIHRYSTELDPNWYKACHAWALANYEVVAKYEDGQDESLDVVIHYIFAAIRGFFKAINLATGKVMRDTLRILTLWFRWGTYEQISIVMEREFATVTVDTWLDVLPQIMARVSSQNDVCRRLVHKLISDLGVHHPQALLFPITVVSKSQSQTRRVAGELLLDRMCNHSAAMVHQAILIGRELIRAACVWHEMWAEALELASRYWQTDRDLDAMMTALERVFDIYDRGPETRMEQLFVKEYNAGIQDTKRLLDHYRNTGDQAPLAPAWDIFKSIFDVITRRLKSYLSADLRDYAPALLEIQNALVAVPGTYKQGKPVVTITYFKRNMNIIKSKQRPRRLQIHGSDGQDYEFLLKAHEDLKQDERAMQLFDLVNSLLVSKWNSARRRLHIGVYSVIPLSGDSGLLSWVKKSDTLHTLISEHRTEVGVRLDMEQATIDEFAPENAHNRLTKLQKVEAFQRALSSTDGRDLYRILWNTSNNPQIWLNRRTEYTRSLAVMSMVGYILGLGDRHPSNLLIVASTGTVVHIDFGDCWEIAQRRDQFPEKNVHFRLTRMMIKAMEIAGTHGTFRITSKTVMDMLRNNQDSVVAVLEALVHDPLLAWYLQATKDAHPDYTLRRTATENNIMQARGPDQNPQAIRVLDRIKKKLCGRDFNTNKPLTSEEQVGRLIGDATSAENLSLLFIGWCAVW